MEKLCRLCLKCLSDDGSAVSVFSTEKGQCLSEMIYACTSILVKQDNKQPNCVCVKCSEALLQCNDFRENCLRADRQLVKYWERQTKNEDSGSSPNAVAEALENECSISKNLEIELNPDFGDHEQPRDKDNQCSDIKPIVNETAQIKESANGNNKKAIYIKKKKIHRKSLEAVRDANDQLSESKCKKPPNKPISFQCEFCNKIYPSEGGWRYHVHTIHSQSYQPFLCDLCGKAFKAKKNMEVHKRSVHFKVKENLCDVCGVKFATKYGLRVHQVWHTGEKKYKCQVCEARFASNGKLNTHLIIHEGFKKFMCEVCSRVFRWKKDFVVHMRTHTGEKPYVCKICNKAFASLTNKRKHESSHANYDKKNTTSQNVPSKLSDEPLKLDSTN